MTDAARSWRTALLSGPLAAIVVHCEEAERSAEDRARIAMIELEHARAATREARARLGRLGKIA